MCEQSTTTLPAPMLADVDWPRFRAEAEALAAEMYAEWHPINGLTRKEAAMCAAAEVQRRYEAELVEQAVAEQARAEAEQLAKRRASVERAARKAAYHLAGGLDIRQAADGSFLVPSGTRGNVIHRVSPDGQQCSCEAGQAARPCWHVEAVAQHLACAPQAAALTFKVRNLPALLERQAA